MPGPCEGRDPSESHGGWWQGLVAMARPTPRQEPGSQGAPGQPWASGTSPGDELRSWVHGWARQGCGELETGPATVSLGQGLMDQGDWRGVLGHGEGGGSPGGWHGVLGHGQGGSNPRCRMVSPHGIQSSCWEEQHVTFDFLWRCRLLVFGTSTSFKWVLLWIVLLVGFVPFATCIVVGCLQFYCHCRVVQCRLN